MTTNNKVVTSKIFRVDSKTDVAHEDEDSVDELLSLAKSLQRKMSKKPANDEGMDEHGEKYKDMSDEAFLRATEVTMANAREAHQNHVSRVAVCKTLGNDIPKEVTIPKRTGIMPRFHYR
jgi:hypothetical protein